MRAVGDDPQPVGPRDDRAGAAFALVVEHRQCGIDAGDLLRRIRLRDGCGACGHGCRDELTEKDAARRHRVRSVGIESQVRQRAQGAADAVAGPCVNFNTQLSATRARGIDPWLIRKSACHQAPASSRRSVAPRPAHDTNRLE